MISSGVTVLKLFLVASAALFSSFVGFRPSCCRRTISARIQRPQPFTESFVAQFFRTCRAGVKVCSMNSGSVPLVIVVSIHRASMAQQVLLHIGLDIAKQRNQAEKKVFATFHPRSCSSSRRHHRPRYHRPSHPRRRHRRATQEHRGPRGSVGCITY